MNGFDLDRKESVILYYSQVTALRELPADDFKDMILALFEYAVSKARPVFDGSENAMTMKILFKMIAPQIDRDNEKYRRTCERNQKRAQDAWNKKKKATPQHAVAYHSMPRSATDADTDTDTDTDTEKDTDTDAFLPSASSIEETDEMTPAQLMERAARGEI